MARVAGWEIREHRVGDSSAHDASTWICLCERGRPGHFPALWASENEVADRDGRSFAGLADNEAEYHDHRVHHNHLAHPSALTFFFFFLPPSGSGFLPV